MCRRVCKGRETVCVLPTEYPEISEDLKKLYEFVKDKYP